MASVSTVIFFPRFPSYFDILFGFFVMSQRRNYNRWSSRAAGDCIYQIKCLIVKLPSKCCPKLRANMFVFAETPYSAIPEDVLQHDVLKPPNGE